MLLDSLDKYEKECKKNVVPLTDEFKRQNEAAKKSCKKPPANRSTLLDAIRRERDDIAEAKNLCERLLVESITITNASPLLPLAAHEIGSTSAVIVTQPVEGAVP